MTLGEQVASELLTAETKLKAKLGEVTKAQKACKAAVSRIAKKPWPFSETRKLLDELAEYANGPVKEEIETLRSELNRRVQESSRIFEQVFVESLISEARKLNLHAGSASGGYHLAAFGLTLDFSRGTGVLTYGDQPVTRPFSLDASKIVCDAAELMASELAIPTDVPTLAHDFGEAIRVALLRRHRPIEGRELRCPLPDLFREMRLMHYDRSQATNRRTFRDYSLARFVVELQTLVQSDFNMTARNRFRLETAVIENTKNVKKSVFFPRNLGCGYGEGTYFQAVVLVNEN